MDIILKNKNLYVVKHWNQRKIIGIFSTENQAMKCISNKMANKNYIYGDKGEYDIITMKINNTKQKKLLYDCMSNQ